MRKVEKDVDLLGARVLLQLYMVAGCPSISETVNSLS